MKNYEQSPKAIPCCDVFVTDLERRKVNKYKEKLSLYLYMSLCLSHPRAMPAYVCARGAVNRDGFRYFPPKIIV